MTTNENDKTVTQERPREGHFNEKGQLICDPAPLKYPTGIRRPPSREQALDQILRRHEELKAFNARYENETDFDISELPDGSGMKTVDMLSPYERQAIVYDMEPDHPPMSDVSGEQDTPPQAGTPSTPPTE